MRTEVIRDTRLLDALEYIDDAYIASAARYKMKYAPASADEPKITWRTPLKHSKIYIALAASLLLLAMASPLVSFFTYVVSNFTAGAGSGMESSEMLNTEPIETTNVIEETNQFFWMYTPELEPLTQEQVDACNQAFRIYAYGPLDEFIASSDLDKESTIKYYEKLKFISTEKDRPYFGTFNGAIVTAGLMIGISGMEIENVELGGHTIHFQHYGGISVYKDGTVVGIYEAYERGWLTDDDIGTISERMDKFNQALNKQ